MRTASLVLAVVGAALTAIGALVLVVWISPAKEKYQGIDGGGAAPGPPLGIELLLRDQGRVGGLIAVGSALQLLAVVLSVLAPSG